jgi:divinyl chlorophyllide a 8-vinyl-reductase
MSNDELHRAPQRVLLAGATGYIGRAVAAELLRRGCRVVAVVRRGSTAPEGCDVLEADVTDLAALVAATRSLAVDAVVSCLASRTGTPEDAWAVDYQANSNLLGIARAAGARRFVLVSAICVQRPQLAFQRAKLAFEAELAAADLVHVIVRPTAFFKSLAGQVQRVQTGKPFLVFGDGARNACKPIGEGDLACFVCDCLTDPSRANRVLPIGGPGPALTPREQGELLFELAGIPPRFRRLPVGMFDVAAGILGCLARVFPPLAAKAELARIGRYYATESMLVWNGDHYDADATPSWGSETLRDFYTRVLEDGLTGQELGAHKLFR